MFGEICIIPYYKHFAKHASDFSLILFEPCNFLYIFLPDHGKYVTVNSVLKGEGISLDEYKIVRAYSGDVLRVLKNLSFIRSR